MEDHNVSTTAELRKHLPGGGHDVRETFESQPSIIAKQHAELEGTNAGDTSRMTSKNLELLMSE